MGKIVIGENQNLLLTNGHIIKAKNLKEGDSLFGFNYKIEKYTEAIITNIKDSSESVSLFSTSHGRIITCPKNTIFSGSLRKGFRSITTFNNKFDNYSWKNYIQCINYLRKCGKKAIDNETADLLHSSIFYLNDKRPNNKPSLIQSIPKMLSTLTLNSLKKVLKDLSFIRNLDLYSKDLLILLLSRLGYEFNGKSHGRSSEEVSGSIKITVPDSRECVSCKPLVAEEKLTLLGDSDNKALELETDSPVLIIGSIICRTT